MSVRIHPVSLLPLVFSLVTVQAEQFQIVPSHRDRRISDVSRRQSLFVVHLFARYDLPPGHAPFAEPSDALRVFLPADCPCRGMIKSCCKFLPFIHDCITKGGALAATPPPSLEVSQEADRGDVVSLLPRVHYNTESRQIWQIVSQIGYGILPELGDSLPRIVHHSRNPVICPAEGIVVPQDRPRPLILDAL